MDIQRNCIQYYRFIHSEQSNCKNYLRNTFSDLSPSVYFQQTGIVTKILLFGITTFDFLSGCSSVVYCLACSAASYTSKMERNFLRWFEFLNRVHSFELPAKRFVEGISDCIDIGVHPGCFNFCLRIKEGNQIVFVEGFLLTRHTQELKRRYFLRVSLCYLLVFITQSAAELHSDKTFEYGDL